MVEAVLTGVKFTPLGDRVLVKTIKSAEAHRSGIIIPDTAKEKPYQGEVMAVGKGKITEEGKLIPMDVKVGDKVLYGKYSATEIKIDKIDHLIIQQEDILGIVTP